MDLRKVKKLIELLESSDLAEIEVSEGDDSVRITRYASGAPAAVAAPAPVAAPVAAATPAAAAPTPAVEAEPAGHIVTSPMVGTVYLASSPEVADFVKVGDRVSKGDTLCVVEAMKMFNPIESDVSGVVTEIIVNNATPVEFGQSLFVIGD